MKTGAVKADVCLVLEGSYPYVTGGVASWVHQLITGLPELSFALLTIVPDAEFASVDRYELPSNVVVRKNVMLFDRPAPARTRGVSRELQAAVEGFHAAPDASRCPFFGTIEKLWRREGHRAHGMLTQRASWELVKAMYMRLGRQVSFLDYFWTWRAIHTPVFRLFDAELPEARVYHALSTGYAGLLAAIGKQRAAAGMLLTEHGIYTREREIEIAQAEWIFRDREEGSTYAPEEAFFKAWWRRLYRFQGQLAYDMADQIVALTHVNRSLQEAAGAEAGKLKLISNGVDVSAFAPRRAPRDWADRPFRVGLVGRVVPIKDIKTFLRAVQLAAAERPIEAYVLGPTDEDPEYMAECEALVETLDLGRVVTFTGRVDVAEWLGRLDLVALTSLSESQPLALLESFAAGVPAIATDVGACREMIEGRAGDDALLGPAGQVCPVASPDAIAGAIGAIAADPVRYRRMAEAAVARVERFYRLSAVFEAYRELYGALAAAPAGGR